MLAIDKEAILRSIRANDLEGTSSEDIARLKDEIAGQAVAIATLGFDELVPETLQIKGRPVHCVRSTPHLIVLRRLNSIVRLSANIQPSDRDTVVRRLATILSEGVPHRIYKFDIKSFFESINTTTLLSDLAFDNKIPRSTTLLLSKYFERLRSLNIQGVPRGIPLSATLSEYAMHNFDATVSRLPDVYYYARYVDDIIIVTGNREERSTFIRKVRKCLPHNLSFNFSKTQVVDAPVQRNSTGAIIGNFNYLGYNFAVRETTRSGDRLTRAVDLSIAPNKIRRLKSRISRAVSSYVADPNPILLHRRLQLLTGNYNVRNFVTAEIRNVGLYCNYRRVTQTQNLKELDSFLRSIVVGKKSKLSQRLAAVASRVERTSLLKYSFASSFDLRTFYNFSGRELQTLARCWRDA